MAAPTPTKVPVHSGVLDYITNWQNDLMAFCSVPVLGKLYAYMAGKDSSQLPWIKGMQETAILFFAFADFKTITSAPFNVYKDIKSFTDYSAEKDESKKNTVATEIRKNNEDFPIVEGGSATDPRIWTAYRVTANVGRMFSSFVLAYAGLRAAGIIQSGPSANLRVWGSIAGFSAQAIDVYDLQRKIAEKSGNLEYSRAKVKNRKDGSKPQVDLDEHNKCYVKSCQWDQITKAFFIGFKVMGILTALELANKESLLGRMFGPASGFAKGHASLIYDALFVGATATTLYQHVYYGATVKELETRNVIKS